MALFPLVCGFEDDFLPQLLPVDTENTMDEVAKAAAHHSVNRRVLPKPGRVMRVRVQGASKPLPRDLKVKDAGWVPMETIEVFYE